MNEIFIGNEEFMLNKETFDPTTRLLQTNVRELLQKQVTLKKEIAMIEKKLEGHVVDMRKFMANNGYKKIELQGLRMTYSYPRKYIQMKRTKQEVVKEHPELFEERIGHEKLRIASAKEEEETMKELEVHDKEIQKEGLRLLVELARDRKPEDDYSYDIDDE